MGYNGLNKYHEYRQVIYCVPGIVLYRGNPDQQQRVFIVTSDPSQPVRKHKIT